LNSARDIVEPDALMLEHPEASPYPRLETPAEEDAAPSKLPLKFEEVLMAATMGAIALITAANVVTRYLTNISLAFTEEFSTALMVVMAMVGTAYAVAGGRHIRIGYFVDNLGPRGRLWAELLALGATGLCFLIMLVYGAQMVWDDYQYEVLSPGLGYPQWVFTLWLPALSAVVLLRTVERALHWISRYRND